MKIAISLTSSLHVGQRYIDLTENIASRLALGGHSIIYGGTDYGMMAKLAQSYKESGGKDLIGVMAQNLIDVTKAYKAYDRLDQSHIVLTMEERKKMIIELSDGFIILPGGWGTMEEIGTIIGGKANKLFDKPIVIVNYKGFYTKLIEFFNYMTLLQFTKVSVENIAFISDDIEECLHYLEGYKQNFVPDKFID